MAKFIELTQRLTDDFLTKNNITERKIRVNIDHIDFYYDKRIVFAERNINVFESYDEITKLIKEQL